MSSIAVHPVSKTRSQRDRTEGHAGHSGWDTGYEKTGTTLGRPSGEAERLVGPELIKPDRHRDSKAIIPIPIIARIKSGVLFFNTQFESSIFATTALVAMSGAAMAEVTLSGSAVAGLLSQEHANNDDNNGTELHYELDLDITFSGSTDNGLTFGASMDLDEDSQSSDHEIFISGAFGTLTLGRVDAMLDAIGVADIGFDGIGVDNDLEALRNLDDQNVTYVYEGAGFTFGLSYGIEDSENFVNSSEAGSYGILLGYEMDGFAGEIAYNYNEDGGDSAWGLELGYSTDMYGVKAVYIENSFGDSGFGLEGSYTIDALTITAVFADHGGINDYGIGAEYDLGGGLSLAGGIGEVDNDTVWDLGLTMDF